MVLNYPRWSQLPYTGEKTPPKNPEEPLAGSWPLIFLKRDGNGWFTGPLDDPIPQVKDPDTIEWKNELKVVRRTLENLTPEQQRLADYWGTGNVTKQISPIIDRLIDTYTIYKTKIPPKSLSTPRAARILALTQAAIADAGIVTWTIKYEYDVARPNQQDHYLPTYLCTPRHPTYVSGHSVSMGVAAEVLGYLFPIECVRLQALAEECSAARIYAGVHFPIDTSEGLRLGRAIGKSLVNYFSTQENSEGNPVDQPYIEDRNPVLPPDGYPYKQAIPFDFIEACQSTVFKAPSIDGRKP